MTKLEIILLSLYGLLFVGGVILAVVEEIKKRQHLVPRLVPRYEKDEVFTELTEKNEYGRNIYEGFIKSEYLKKLTVEDIAMICDDYKINFGYHVDVAKSGKFVCIIWTD